MAEQPKTSKYQQFNIVALGWGLSAALVVLYVLCWLAVLVVPGLAHGWLALFSTAPIGSGTGLIAGIISSAVAGWITAVVLGFVYNSLLGP
jgi:hypothetical protein